MSDGEESDWQLVDELEASSNGLPAATSRIQRTHWQAPNSCSTCCNTHCGRQFSLFKPRKWCHQCGFIFCQRCVSFANPLDFGAAISTQPDAKLYPVCASCFKSNPHFERNTQELGISRSLSSTFQERRRHFRGKTAGGANDPIKRAATRLVRAYNQTPELGRRLSSAFGISGAWSKVNVRPAMTTDPTCNGCDSSFGLLLARKACSLCGNAFCKMCLFESVELYATETGTSTTKVQVYHPELSPPSNVTSTVLPGCDACLKKLAQATKHDTRVKLQRSSDPSSHLVAESVLAQHSVPFLQACKVFNDELYPAKRDAATAYERYVNLAIKVRCTLDGRGGTTHGQDTIHQLAKCHFDLREQLDRVQRLTQGVAGLRKRHKATLRPTETRCLSGIVTAYARFYQHRIGQARATATDIAQYFPEPVLAAIQAQIDMQALEFVWLKLRQSAVELMAFAELEELVMQVMLLLDNIEAELQVCMTSCEAQQDWDAELIKLKDMVREMGKETPLFAQFVGQKDGLRNVQQCWQQVLKACSQVLHVKGSENGTKVTRHRLAQLWKQGGNTLQAVIEADAADAKAPEQNDNDAWVMV